ncbi:MAG: hypothetical protein WBD02_00915 [Acidimicrobiia bacterium]
MKVRDDVRLGGVISGVAVLAVYGITLMVWGITMLCTSQSHLDEISQGQPFSPLTTRSVAIFAAPGAGTVEVLDSQQHVVGSTDKLSFLANVTGTKTAVGGTRAVEASQMAIFTPKVGERYTARIHHMPKTVRLFIGESVDSPWWLWVALGFVMVTTALLVALRLRNRRRLRRNSDAWAP